VESITRGALTDPRIRDTTAVMSGFLAPDKRCADVEGVAPFLDLLAPIATMPSPILSFLQLAELLRSVSVYSLTDGQERILLAQLDPPKSEAPPEPNALTSFNGAGRNPLPTRAT
jgi:hypothetical protein